MKIWYSYGRPHCESMSHSLADRKGSPDRYDESTPVFRKFSSNSVAVKRVRSRNVSRRLVRPADALGAIAFVEDDPGNYDPQFWLDYFSRIHADAACLSAGGCVAFYPTKIPLHYRSKWLGNSDPFGDLVAGCRKLGMNVIARTDPHAVHQDVYDAHPDWIAVDADGQEAAALGDAGTMGDVRARSVQLRVHDRGDERDRDAVSRSTAIFTNRWAGSGMCYCEHCQENFRAAPGMDLPRTHESAGPSPPRIHSLAAEAALRAVAVVGRRDSQAINPEARYHRQRRRRRAQRLDMKTHRRTGADSCLPTARRGAA